MHRTIGSLILGAALIYGAVYAWKHRPETMPRTAAEQKVLPNETTSGESSQSHPFVKIVGPLVDYVSQRTTPQDAPPKTLSHKGFAEDRFQESPVGSSSRIVQKTFTLARAVQFAFEIPPRAATPRLHGTFRSYVQQAVSPAADDSAANINVLLMNEEQFGQFSTGREPDVLFVTDASHCQDVNFALSPSQNRSVKYHLVFRSTTVGAPKKVVQADFAVDF